MEFENNTGINYMQFDDVPTGRVFLYNDQPFFKLDLGAFSPFQHDESQAIGDAVNLEDGTIQTFPLEELVIYVYAVLILEN